MRTPDDVHVVLNRHSVEEVEVVIGETGKLPCGEARAFLFERNSAAVP